MNTDLAETCLRYLDGDLTADELQDFNRLLSESPEAADLLAQLALDEQHYRVTPAEAQDDPLTALLEMERQAELSDWPVVALPHEHAQAEDAGSRSTRDLAAVGGYALRLALTSQAAKRIFAYVAVAAALLLVAVLLNPWTGNEDVATAPFADNLPNKPAASTESTPRRSAVATLTATHNARWADDSAEGASAPGSTPRPGDALAAGQRLNLIAGFAEITTARGAIAILEAPCVVELMGNDNALRLHAGKLVGICETESSKGFLVRTPHMDVTDLGTRFGVAIDESGNTLAEVFDGLVAVNTGANSVAVKLASNESLAIDSRGDRIPRERFAEDTFVALNATLRGIASLTDVRLVSQPLDPSDPAAWPDGEQVYVYEELGPYRLDADLPVSIHQPGQYQSFELPEPSSRVAAGTTIRSYIVMVKSKSQDQHSTARGSLRFNGKILGIIANNQDEQGFVRAVTLPTSPLLVNLQQKSRWPDANTSPQRRDTVTIGDDKQTVSVSFNVQGSYDIIRVIVQEPTQQPTGVVP